MAQFGKLLEKMSQTVGNDEGVLATSGSTVDNLVGAGAVAVKASTTTFGAQAAATAAGFEGLIQALDQRDEELEKEKEAHEAARQISALEQTAQAVAGDDMANWMGFGTGAGQLGGCEDFSALLDFNGAFGTESGNLFDTNISQPHNDSFDALLSGAEDTSPLLAQLSSAVSSLVSSFENSDNIPGSTATQLFSEFSSPEEGTLGDMFPPLFATRPAAMNKNTLADRSAFENVDASNLADRGGIFSLPLFGGIPTRKTSLTATSPTNVMAEDPIQSYGSFNMAQASSTPKDSPMPGFMSPVVAAASPQDLFRPPSYMLPVAPTPEVSSRAPASPSLAPATPALEALKSFEGGVVRSNSVSSAAGTPALKKRKPYEPTGTRSSRPLLDATAPTMTKTYAAPGKTTRKAIPVGFQKKLKLQSNEQGDAVLPEDANASEILNEIEEKRRKNCVAARESRRRKMEHLTGLKDEIKGWRDYAEQVEEMLRRVGRPDLLEMLPAQPEAMDLEE